MSKKLSGDLSKSPEKRASRKSPSAGGGGGTDSPPRFRAQPRSEDASLTRANLLAAHSVTQAQDPIMEVPVEVEEEDAPLSEFRDNGLPAWRTLDEERVSDFRMRLTFGEIFLRLDEDTKLQVYDLFTREQIDEVLKVDTDWGFDLTNREDQLEALNSLPAGEKRKLVQRVKDRQTINQALLIDEALAKRHPGDLYAPQAYFPDFSEADVENKLLQHLIIAD